MDSIHGCIVVEYCFVVQGQGWETNFQHFLTHETTRKHSILTWENIKHAQIANYIKSKIDSKLLPLDPHGVCLVLTSKDVSVEQFCMSSCGFHGSIVTTATKRRVIYVHVGDPFRQCPSLCSWPFALPAYGPPGQAALVAPNGVGTNGIIMNLATILAGAATNPFNFGYFQGDVLALLEAVTACPGIFGPRAYPGYPGDLKVDKLAGQAITLTLCLVGGFGEGFRKGKGKDV
ncbi:hypothetical protein ACSBR1_021887 [Camellia fascicularis]